MNLVYLSLACFGLLVPSTALILFPDEGDYRNLYPTVCLSIGVSTHEYVMPYFLGLIENLKYPKDRLRLNFYLAEKREEIEVRPKRKTPEIWNRDQVEEIIKKYCLNLD